MNKLHLSPDELRVESFAIAAPAVENETAANAITQGANTCYHCTRFGCPQTDLC